MTLQETTFDQAKEETYARFDGRCRRLLADFLREKNKAVCAVCSGSCSDGVKAQRALRYLVERFTVASYKRCERVDRLMCLLSPSLMTADLIVSLAERPKAEKRVKLMAKEIVTVKEKLLDILRGEDGN